MWQAQVNIRGVALLLGAMISAIGWASTNPLGGEVSAGDLGKWTINVKDKHVEALYRGGGVCSFPENAVVLDGHVDGDVVVGRVRVCQTGEGCAQEDEYAFLGLWNGASLTGTVTLRSGCQSPGKHLKILPWKDALAAKQTEGPAKMAAIAGAEALGSRKYDDAIAQFKNATAVYADYMQAWSGLGTAYLKNSNHDDSIKSFNQAMNIVQRHNLAGPAVADLYFNAACAYAHRHLNEHAVQFLGASRREDATDRTAALNDADCAELRDIPAVKKMMRSRKRSK